MSIERVGRVPPVEGPVMQSEEEREEARRRRWERRRQIAEAKKDPSRQSPDGASETPATPSDESSEEVRHIDIRR